MRLDVVSGQDLPEVHRLIERAYRGETARSGWSHEADLLTGPRTSIAELADHLSEPTRRLLCRRQEGSICACVLLQDKGDRLVYIGMLTVDPELQAQGVGKRLLAAAEAYARAEWSAQRMEMQVFSSRRELLAFYERRGYRLTGERRPFPYAEAPNAGALRDDLEFLVLEKPL